MIPYKKKEGENIIDEIFIQSISYLFGFYINSNEDSLIKIGWAHIFFFLLICGDVYAQQLDNYFIEKIKINRKQYKDISIKLKKKEEKENKKIIGKRYSLHKKERLNETKNKNINIKGVNNTTNFKGDKKENLNNKESNKEKSLVEFVNEIGDDIKNKNIIIQKNDEEKGKRLIKTFLNIFEQNFSDYELSQKSNFYPIIRVLKKLFEELIIFFLICTSISKMNIWSYIYMPISIFYIFTNRAMKKYYILFCFMIFSIFIQIFVFIFNLQVNTDPRPKIDILNDITERFNIPLYKYLKINEKKAYFFGLGVSNYQIYLIWMEFIEVVIIYIYLEYFSYSIYYRKNRIGRSKDKLNKIQFKNLDLNLKEISLKLSNDEYEEHKKCMKYNFDIDIWSFNDFKDTMKKGEHPSKKLKVLSNIINENGDYTELSSNFPDEEKEVDEMDDLNENKDSKSLTHIPRNRTYSKILNKDEEERTDQYFSALKNFIFLSFHNIILIIIIIISMMISGLISIIYIIYSLAFLIKSTSIYLGKQYSYPRAIKKILRVLILIDITAQIIYQSPYFDSENIKGWIFILQNIGLNKILIFQNQEGDNGQNIYNYIIIIIIF
jgi:hypothetical protein